MRCSHGGVVDDRIAKFQAEVDSLIGNPVVLPVPADAGYAPDRDPLQGQGGLLLKLGGPAQYQS